MLASLFVCATAYHPRTLKKAAYKVARCQFTRCISINRYQIRRQHQRRHEVAAAALSIILLHSSGETYSAPDAAPGTIQIQRHQPIADAFARADQLADLKAISKFLSPWQWSVRRLQPVPAAKRAECINNPVDALFRRSARLYGPRFDSRLQ